MVWQEDSMQNGKIYAKRWKKVSQWESLGVVTTRFCWKGFSLAIGKNKLGVAFAQSTVTTTGVTSRIHVKRLTGNSWEQVGPALRHDLGSSFSLAMDKHENPID